MNTTARTVAASMPSAALRNATTPAPARNAGARQGACLRRRRVWLACAVTRARPWTGMRRRGMSRVLQRMGAMGG